MPRDLIRTISRCAILTITLLGLIGVTDCSAKRTEELRDWVRSDSNRDKLIVFVHGFNSSKNDAWGQFPALVKDDDDFKDFNIHLFGYPTQFCHQVSDIRNQGELLASFLTSIFNGTQPKHREVVLIGHSMGGLVILHALLKLERDHKQLLAEQNIKVLTFGTPYYGLEKTDVLLLFCDNKQANDMRVLNDTLGELAHDWFQRFNRKQGDTPQVPLYTFRGTVDEFIPKTSACAYPQTPCESVDGDHSSMVKPLTRSHLSYLKLKQIATLPKVPHTSEGKIGIWVAKFTGDDASHATQRSLARTLEFFISQDDAQLLNAVEIRELQESIIGKTLKEKEEEVKRLGKDQHASIVVWGDVTRLAGVEELHARVTMVEPLDLPTKTAILAPMSQALQYPQLNTPPGTVMVPPEPIKEPLQLARFLLAVTFMKQQAWTQAARQLDQYIGAGLSAAVRSADIYFYAAFVQHTIFKTSAIPEPLSNALGLYEKAIASYQKEKDEDRYAAVQNNLGVTCVTLAGYGIAPEPTSNVP